MRRFLLFAILMLVAGGAAAQSLAPGDIAIVGMNSDDPNEFAFVNLVDLRPGELIFFTDTGWQANGTFRDQEGLWVYVAPDVVPKGTVTVITNPGHETLPFSTDGDQVFAYQTDPEGRIYLIYGVNNEGDAVWQDDAVDSHTSARPPGLSPFFSSVALPECDNQVYIGVTIGSQSELLYEISRSINWTCNDDIHLNLQIGPMTVTGTLPHKPWFTEYFDETSVGIGETLQFRFEAMDRDPGTTIRYRSRNLPAGAALGESTGILVWTPTAEQEGTHMFGISAFDGNLPTEYPVTVHVVTGSGVETDEQPSELRLLGAYPNPFRGFTTVSFDLLRSGSVRVDVLDLLGRELLHEDLGFQVQGTHKERLDLGSAAPGTYVYRIVSGADYQSGLLVVN